MLRDQRHLKPIFRADCWTGYKKTAFGCSVFNYSPELLRSAGVLDILILHGRLFRGKSLLFILHVSKVIFVLKVKLKIIFKWPRDENIVFNPCEHSMSALKPGGKS